MKRLVVLSSAFTVLTGETGVFTGEQGKPIESGSRGLSGCSMLSFFRWNGRG